MQRALYRIAGFPAGEHEDLLAVWLWSHTESTFSHETALFLHELSDALPVRAHITVPAAWKRRQRHVPDDITLHYADITEHERVWVGPVPATAVRRTLADCLIGTVSVELVAQALSQAAERGLITQAEVMSAQGVNLVRTRLQP